MEVVQLFLVYTLIFQLDYADFLEDCCAVPPASASLKVLHRHTHTHTHATNLDSFGFCFICMLHS